MLNDEQGIALILPISEFGVHNGSCFLGINCTTRTLDFFDYF